MKFRWKIAFLLSAAASAGTAGATREPVDLIIRGGTIYTGSSAPFVGDVAVAGDRIAAVGRRLRNPARRILDARGLIVAPGFIDPHTHLAEPLASDDAQVRLVAGFLMQGVTTAFIGNDGIGNPDIASVLDRARTAPVGINYAAYVGFGPVRRAEVGDTDRPPTAAELARMRAMVASAMCQGALGFSTGLFYAPQNFARTDEVVALAREAGLRGGVYDSHIRDESSYSIGLAASIDEAIAVGRQAGLPVNISHIKALGVDVHGQAANIIQRIEAARRDGQRITADQYPWSASGTTLMAALVPNWAQDGGRAQLLRRLDDPSLAQRLRAEMADNLRRRGGATELLITGGPNRGRTLADVAGADDPVATAIRLIRESDRPVASFNQTDSDIELFMRQPWVMTGSDATNGHPRAYGSFARLYGEYVKRRGVLSLREFIERSSTRTAETFGLVDRGRIGPGAFADIVVFDPRTFSARATYELPNLLAAGVRTVLVNGVAAVEDGALTGAAAGRGLPRQPTAGTCP